MDNFPRIEFGCKTSSWNLPVICSDNFNALPKDESFDFVVFVNGDQTRQIRNSKGCKFSVDDLLAIFEVCCTKCKNVNKHFANLPEPTDAEIAKLVKASHAKAKNRK